MASAVLNVSGPAGSGKSSLIRLLATLIPADTIHHIRFDIDPSGSYGPLRLVAKPEGRMRRSHCHVRPDLVFETFAEAIPSLSKAEENGVIIAETGPHPCFRNAYPYDAKLFIMLPPSDMNEVFRGEDETAGAIERAMQDTSEFAAELFGLERSGPQDSAWFPSQVDSDAPLRSSEQSEEEFLSSPVGTEIASRLQLRPAYQGIVDSDVVFMNTALGVRMREAAACSARIDALLEPLCQRLGRGSVFAACDPLDQRDAKTERGLTHITKLLTAAWNIHT